MDKSILTGHSLVLTNGDNIIINDKKGIAPMLEVIASGADVCGYQAADIIVGKAAAMLFALAGIKEVYAEVLSEKGAETLEKYGIPFEYGQLVPYIINRTKDGMCPMEMTVADIDDLEEAHEALLKKFEQLSGRKL